MFVPMARIVRTLWRFQPVGGGTFHCPRCDRERDYTGTAARPFLALFGRPVLPLRAERTLVTCDACGAVYDVAVTAMDPRQARHVVAEDELALQAVLAAMVFSDSAVRESEKEIARQAARRYARRAAAPEEPTDAASLDRRGLGDPFDRLASLAGVLDPRTKRRILAAAYRVCAADRELHTQEARLLARLGDALELHPREVREVMEEARGG